MPFLSVVVPMYNAQRYVARCLESLRTQSFDDFEVICIDDGSSDGTLAEAQRAVQGDARFGFVSQENKGPSATRNEGMRRSRGKYVLFVDADDFHDQGSFARLVGLARAEQLDALYFSARTEYDGAFMRGVYRDEYASRKNIDGVMSGQQLLIRFLECDSFSVSPVMQLLRREFLLDNGIGFFEGIIQEDNLFTCMVLAHAERAAYLNEPWYVRCVRPGSIMTSTKDIRHVYGHFKCAYEMERWLLEHEGQCESGFPEALLSHASTCYGFAAREAWEVGEEALLAKARQLSSSERIRFIIDVVGASRSLGDLKSEYADSTTFRVGSAIMALPCWLKENFKR